MVEGRCRFCGRSSSGRPFGDWVRPTFVDWDKLVGGEIVCDGCFFWLDEASMELAHRMGKEKPQRMRNYSHFIMAGEWMPLSKGDKAQMRGLLLAQPFPELAAIAVSGQKHIVFRARWNPPRALAGWVQLEEAAVFVEPAELGRLLAVVEMLYAGSSKAEISSGNYRQHRIRKLGLDRWHGAERQIQNLRGSPLFDLALFLAQKGAPSL